MNDKQFAQYLLYEKPLFDYIKQKDSSMNVLVFGWDSFAREFVEQCLQAGQMDSHYLNIKVMTKNADNVCQEYLALNQKDLSKNRSELGNFVNVNGSLENGSLENGEKYADLSFEEFDESDEDIEETVLNLIVEAESKVGKYHYFMISLGDDVLNIKFSKLLAENVSELMSTEKCAIHCVIREEDKIENCGSDIIPVWINETRDLCSLDPRLEQMAYNSHLIWADSINGDVLSEYPKFYKNKYNYESSLALALSIKYKLADLGISLLDDYHKSAYEFWQKLNDNKNNEVMNRLIALEHRRWVLYQICNGWRAPERRDTEYYDSCVKRKNHKDAVNRIHPCIVRSTPTAPLLEDPYSRDRKAWDKSAPSHDPHLDELDKFSVEYHRRMFKRADVYRANNPLENPGGEIQTIAGIINGYNNNSVDKEWNRFLLCVKNILDGNTVYSKQFENYKADFTKAIERLNLNDIATISSSLTTISNDIWPVLQANMYTNFKRFDETLVKRIPFILTYNSNNILATSFKIPSSLNEMNDFLFRNVASLTVIKPRYIIFLLYIENEERIETVRQMIYNMCRYLSYMRINIRKNFLVAIKNNEGNEERWRRCFQRLLEREYDVGYKYIDGYELKLVRNDDEAEEFYFNALKKSLDNYQKETDILYRDKYMLFDGTENVFRSMMKNCIFLKRITGDKKFQYFEYDYRRRLFTTDEKSRHLSFICDNSFLGIEELFSLAGAEAMEYNYPVLGTQYRTLWRIYIGRNRDENWRNNIINSVRNWNVLCDILAEYDRNYQDEKINRRNLHTIFQENERNYSEDWWPYIIAIISELIHNGFLNANRINNEGRILEFTYANKDIKEVLTKAGEILEICTYYSVCEKGLFDDVFSGFHFNWREDNILNEEGIIQNELDLVLTKGFQSIIVECKAKNLDQDMYFKMDSLSERFGIGAKKVLLTTANKNAPNNARQVERGNMMGIKTISIVNDIENVENVEEIGDILYKVLL